MVIKEKGVPWYYDIMKFLELGAHPSGATKRERRSIRMMTMQYILCGGQLYRRFYNDIHLRCLKKEELERVMEEIHQEIYGSHMNGRIITKKILRIRYYWSMMETICVDFVKSCHNCQTLANLNHVLPSEFYSMTSLWPFSVCGIDVIGMIAPKALNGHK